MRFTLVAFTAALVATAAAVPNPDAPVVHERREAAPKKWVKRSKVNGSAKLPMRIGLQQRNLENGHNLLMEVSEHDSPRYGQHYTAEEVAGIFAPSQDAVDAVRQWLESAGVSGDRISQSWNKQWIQFDADAEEAERLLKTEYYVYEHESSGHTNIACDEYHVPAHVKEHVDYITPGLKLMKGSKASGARNLEMRSEREKRGFRTAGNAPFSGPVLGATLTPQQVQILAAHPQSLDNCDTTITPACIAAMYNITQATKASPGNELGIFEEGDYYHAPDLVQFFQTYASSIPSTVRPVLEGVDGGKAPHPSAGGESNLDLQISYPIIYPQNSIIYQTDDGQYASGQKPSDGFLNTFFDAIDGSYCTFSAFGETGNSPIDPVYPDSGPKGYKGQLQCGAYKPANVISISYGEQEDDLPTNYQQRQCAEMMKLGLQGVSLVVASGDSGVAARGTDDNNDDGCLGNGNVFNPDFPASCPYITVLGATVLPAGASAAADQEVAVSRFPSGGGFSNIYPRPSYQDAAVGTYLSDHTPTYKTYNVSGTSNPTSAQIGQGIYNIGGRGYPDFAAIGDNVAIILNGQPTLIGGTSASSPVFAAILNRINEERLAAGKSTIGFVNPTLYSNPQVLHDITEGNNAGCNSQGFSASQGWDPVTGLGTPNYPAMLDLFMGLP